MRAPIEDQIKLLDLQPIDTKLTQLRHKKSHPASQATIDKLAEENKKVDRLRVMTQSAKKQVESKLNVLQTDIDQAQSRLNVQEERLNSGKGSHREVIALDGEVKRLRHRLEELDADKQTVLQQIGVADAKLDKCAQLTDKIAQRTAQLESEQAEESAQLSQEIASLEEQRAKLAGEIDDALLGEYERVRALTGGTGVVGIRNQHCPAIGFDLSPAMWDRLARADRDEVITCEDNFYILVRLTDED